MKLDWTNAEWANGPKLARWCEENGIVFERKDDSLVEWKRGRNPQVFTVDKMMTRNLRHISELPDSVWCESPKKNRYSKKGMKKSS